MVLAPAALGDGNGQAHAALLGEFEGIGKQVLEHLLQALGVGDQAARKVRIGSTQSQPPVFRLVAERPRDHFEQAGEEDFLGFHRDRAGFDLRKIENVADQVQQVGSGAVNGSGKLDLLGRQIACPDCR
jgi:hypothetical protein